MGVKFNRDYYDISADLVKAVQQITDCYRFFEMEENDWNELDQDEQQEVVRTLCDDLFYGLGDSSVIAVGSGQIEYDPKSHVIKETAADQVAFIVRLI